ncbi:MAG: hypothetical protein WBW81_05575 [Methylocella sp.]
MGEQTLLPYSPPGAFQGLVLCKGYLQKSGALLPFRHGDFLCAGKHRPAFFNDNLRTACSRDIGFSRNFAATFRDGYCSSTPSGRFVILWRRYPNQGCDRPNIVYTDQQVGLKSKFLMNDGR